MRRQQALERHTEGSMGKSMTHIEETNPQSVPPFAPMEDPLVSIIIPIYNEREMIGTVLRRVRSLPFRKQLVLVDDHSGDGTYEFLVKEEAPKPDTVVLRHERNRGKGRAIRTGLERATGQIVLIQDADLEYRPEELPALLVPMVEGRTAVVYGSRFMGSVKRMRLPNRVANLLLAWMVSRLYGQRITDEATAYKIFRREVIGSIDLECERFEFCPEVTAKVLRKGYRIVELPVSFEARTVEEGKKIGWRDFITAVRVLIRCRL
jgi:dolichol-phosphate mannosyltransferase